MARVLVKRQPWGTLWEKDPTTRALRAPLTGQAASISTTVYTAATGTTPVTSFVTDSNGDLPGWVEEGVHTLTVNSVPTQVEAVGGIPKAAKQDLPINAADYGVKASNTAAQNNTPLADALYAAAGKCLYIPAGVYNYSTGLSGIDLHTKITGDGKGATILNYTGTGVALTWGQGLSTSNMDFVLDGIRIDGTASAAGGLHLNGFQDFTLINCDFKGFSGGYGIHVDNCNSGVSFGTDVRQCATGWRVGNNANLNTYIGGQISSCTTGIHVYSLCYSNRWVGPNIVVNNRAVYLQAGQLTILDNCFFEANLTGQSLPASVFIGDSLDATTADFTRIVNCYFVEVGIDWGVRVWRGSETLIAGNVHGGTGAQGFVRCDTNAIDTVLRDNVKGTSPLVSDAGVRTQASGPGYGFPSVASAPTITMPAGAEVVTITGTTGITSITGSHVGRRVTLVFAGALTVTDGSTLKLAGNFTTTADDTLTLVWDGTFWNETSRSVN